MRSQASEVTRVHSVYVVDNDDILLGRLSLKDLLVANPKTKIKSIYKKNVDHVYDIDSAESVASTMQKYDLGAIPVVDKKKNKRYLSFGKAAYLDREQATGNRQQD